MFAIADPMASDPLAASSRAPPQVATEYELKAQFLLRFATTYVKWPETTFEDKTKPFVIAVLDTNPFGKSLNNLLKDKKVGEHPIKLVHFVSIDALGDCQLLYVPTAREKQLEKISKFYKGKPTLIVAESEAAADNGAHIGIFLENSKLQFAINPSAAKLEKIEISSELLKLARIKPKPGRDQ